MYERVLDERQVARTTIDTIRSTTDAPLYTCIEAARNLMAVIAPFIQDESFSRIRKAVDEFTVCVDDCYDYHFLMELKENLSQIFTEKDELSFSYDQDDDVIVKYLGLFSDCVMKTDPRIPMRVVSMDDFEWLTHLINVYQMDQNYAVRRAGLKCIASLTDACPDLIPFLLNSRLPEVLALDFQTQDVELSSLHLLALELLTITYSTEKTPPLHHFEFFDANFFMRLIKHLRDHPTEILNFIVNFNYLYPETHENGVINALEIDPCSLLGELLVKSVNERITDRRLKFFIDISKGELYKQLFYANDLNVFSHIVARELVNSESKKIRSRCMECIVRLAEIGYCDGMVLEAVENSDFKDTLHPETFRF
ncbi:hypothetical protein KIN20_021054 [Parelaphostrongylus tenuis]|uniref:SPIN90/Ldb17 leucine-rich domain-containing protein n=1 Tax=Parelaphostrongylus tenuis TaxID=148309 RepID=A0AAD5N6P3_PARTN|nr:hypothetical protein KIN20_021054 [Parelaphostrongylus tenuis]